MIHRRVNLGLFDQLFKALPHVVLIAQGLIQTECIDAKAKDVFEILFCCPS